MPQIASTISSGFVSAFLDAAGITSSERDELLGEAGVAPGLIEDAQSRVTEDQFVKLYRRLAAKLDDEMPNLLSHPVRRGAMKLAALSLIDASTIEAVLNRYVRLQRVFIHDFEMHFMREPEFSTVLIKEPDSGRRCKTMGIELNLKVLHGFLSWLVGREMPVVRVNFAFEPPPYATELRNLFPGPVFFNQPDSRIVFDSKQMNLRVQRNAAHLQEFVSNLPRGWLFVRMQERLASNQIREYLLHRGLEGAHIEHVAKALNVSVRTLCRRLEEENTAFQQVKDDVRREIAIDRLSRSDTLISHIAGELGFSDVSSFHRAFRAWTGMTPSLYRRTMGRQETEDT